MPSYVKIFLILLFSVILNYANADSWVKAYDNFGKASYGQTSLILPSGEMIIGISSFDNDVIISKTDAKGKTIKEQRFTKTRIVKRILLTKDNQLFVCGMTDSTNAYSGNVFWMKLDLNLNVLWSFESNRNFRDVCESGIQYSDGTYYIVGYGSRTGNNLSDRDAMIYHIGEDGDLLDAKVSSNFGADYFNNLLEAPDGSLIIVGTKIYQVAMDMYVARFSKDLVQQQSKTFGGVEDESGYDLVIDNSSLYILGGTHSAGAGKYDVVLSKLDLNFTVVYTKTFGTPIDESAMSLRKINNELIIVGNMDTIMVKDSTFVPSKIFFIITDLNTNYLNSYYFTKHSRVSSINNLSITNSNELVVAFTSTFFSPNGISDWVILKTDSFKLGCCDYIKQIPIQQSTIAFPERSQNFSFTTAKNILPLGAQTGLEGFKLIGTCSNERDTTQIKNINNSTFCKNQPITFNANVSIEPISGTWIFGDTIKIIDTAGTDVTFRFDTTGTFNVYFISYFQCNSDTDTISINIVNSKPYVVDLKSTGNCINKPITFGVDFTSEDIINYHWNFGVNTSTNDTSNSPEPAFTYSAPGNYTIYLFSETYCGSKVDSIKINIPDKNLVEIDNTIKTYCKNYSIPFGIMANEIPLSTSWDFGDPSSTDNSSSDINTNHLYTKSGNYIITVITDFSCNSDTDTIHIKIIDYFPSSANISYTGLCANEPFDFEVSDVLLNPNYYWEIENNSGITKYYTKSFNHQFLTDGEYTIRVSVADNNCNLGLDTLVINVAEFIIAGITNINDPCLQNLILTPSNPTPNVLWKLSNGFTSTENTLVYTFPASGDYEVLLITNPNSNCSDSALVSVPFIKENANGGVYIPQVFSPNGDGNNDVFIIENTTNNPCKLVSFKVYDRWGKIIYTVNKFESFSWDGKYNGKTVMPGSYIGFLETENGSKSFVINVVY